MRREPHRENRFDDAPDGSILVDSLVGLLVSQGGEFGFELGNAELQWGDELLYLLLSVAGGDELRAVPIIGQDLDAEDALRGSAVAAAWLKFLCEFGMLSGIENLGFAEDFQAAAARVVDQEKGDAFVHREAPGADQLAVASVVGEGDFAGAENPEESSRATTVLNVGPAVFGDGAHVEAVAAFDERNFLGTEFIRGGSLVVGGIAAPVVFVLRLEYGGSEDFVHESIGHGDDV